MMSEDAEAVDLRTADILRAGLVELEQRRDALKAQIAPLDADLKALGPQLRVQREALAKVEARIAARGREPRNGEAVDALIAGATAQASADAGTGA